MGEGESRFKKGLEINILQRKSFRHFTKEMYRMRELLNYTFTEIAENKRKRRLEQLIHHTLALPGSLIDQKPTILGEGVGGGNNTPSFLSRNFVERTQTGLRMK